MKLLAVLATASLALGVAGCSKDDPNTRIKPIDPNIPFPVSTQKSGPGSTPPKDKAEKDTPLDKLEKKDKNEVEDSKGKSEKKDK